MSKQALLCILLFINHLTLFLCEKDYSECGVIEENQHIKGPDNGPNNRVGVWPWMASLGYYEGNKWIHQCGATLISDREHFITAAHCVEEPNADLRVRIGVSELNPSNSSRYDLTLTIILKVIPIERGSGTKTAYFDVAIIQTEKFELNKLARPICLPDEPEMDVDAYRNDQMIITGWGSKERFGKTSDTLKRTDIRVFQQRYCNSTHESRYNTDKSVQIQIPEYFTSQIICAGSKSVNSGTCEGDSGGPLFNFNTDFGSYVQVGVVHGSFGACGDTNIPSIFVRLDDPSIFNFIECALEDRSDWSCNPNNCKLPDCFCDGENFCKGDPNDPQVVSCLGSVAKICYEELF